MFKFISALLAVGFIAMAAPRVAHADVCADLQTVIQDPNAVSSASAQHLHDKLCPNGSVADASAPTRTPAQLTAPDLASTCAAYTDPPLPPTGAPARRAALMAFNTWANADTDILHCRSAEIGQIQHETAVYDAAVVVWQHQLTTQIAQMQANFAQQRVAFAEAHARR